MADWQIKDVADPEEIRVEQGITFRLRKVVFKTGPESGRGGGYMAELRTVGWARACEVHPTREEAIKDGEENLACILEERERQLKYLSEPRELGDK